MRSGLDGTLARWLSGLPVAHFAEGELVRAGLLANRRKRTPADAPRPGPMLDGHSLTADGLALMRCLLPEATMELPAGATLPAPMDGWIMPPVDTLAPWPLTDRIVTNPAYGQFEWEGRPGWTNSHLLDLHSCPTPIAERLAAMAERKALLNGDITSGVSKLVGRMTTRDAAGAIPLLMGHTSGLPRISLVAPANGQSRLLNIWYHSYLQATYPGASYTISTSSDDFMVGVIKEAQLVAIVNAIMPMKGGF